jgi:hypothetical protein
LDFQVAAEEARRGEKLFGFSRFFISRCATSLCGKNGSGGEGRLWYTRSPANHSALRNSCGGSWTMPCIVFGPQIGADLSKHGFDLRRALASAWQAKACADRVLPISRGALSQFEDGLPAVVGGPDMRPHGW